jgi:hypothetical protein
MKSTLFTLVKSLSIVLITGAIALEVWHLQAIVTHRQEPALPPVVFGVAGFALITHGIEAMIAAMYAARQRSSPVFYAVYTFFVGTVGLVELFTSQAEGSD